MLRAVLARRRAHAVRAVDYDESYEGAHQMDPGVRAFLIQFGKSVADQNVVEIQAAYTRTFTRQRGQILEGAAWPPADAVAPLVDNDTVFLNLYKEMYFRHETTPTLESRFESFENYCELFNYILSTRARDPWRMAASLLLSAPFFVAGQTRRAPCRSSCLHSGCGTSLTSSSTSSSRSASTAPTWRI